MADGTNDIRPDVAREIQSISSNEEDQNTRFSLEYHLEPPLNEAEMVGIAEATSQNTRVEEVNLDRCLRDSPAEATSTFLKKLLETHPSIKEINLSSNNLKFGHAEIIGLALKTNTSLQVLKLGNNNIGASGAEAVSKGLRHNKALRGIYVGGNQVGDRGITALAEALCENKTLEKLHLGNNGVTAIGGKVLSSMLEKSSLKELILGWNHLQDEGGKALANSLIKTKSLTKLVLNCTGVGDMTCKAFAAALCENKSLRLLGLCYNARITNIGAEALEDALKHYGNYELLAVHLSDNDPVPSRIYNLCSRNRFLSSFFQQIKQNIPNISLGLLPSVLETVECPDLIYALLKAKPELC